MRDAMVTWLQDAGAWSWHVGLTLLVLLNVAAAGIVVATRNRALVDRWTSRWLAVNLGLLGLGLGGPLVTGIVRFALNALPAFGSGAAQAPK